jgi:deoxyribonuclease-4
MMKATLADVPKLLRVEGLDALEYQAVYWGAKPQIQKENAERFGSEARKNDVWLTMHGSYFINLCGEKRVVDASSKRLIACATAAEWMNAHAVVFHAGFYGRKARQEACRECLEALRRVVATLKGLGIRDVKLGVETMGRPYQLGSLDDVLGICEEVEQTQLAIDWSHLHARDHGRFRTVDDFRKVVMEIERRLGTEAVRNMHCHFTAIEFGDKGERRHRTLEEARYGPDFALLARVMVEFKLRPVVICETPLLDIDAMKMRDMFQDELAKTRA